MPKDIRTPPLTSQSIPITLRPGHSSSAIACCDQSCDPRTSWLQREAGTPAVRLGGGLAARDVPGERAPAVACCIWVLYVARLPRHAPLGGRGELPGWAAIA